MSVQLFYITESSLLCKCQNSLQYYNTNDDKKAEILNFTALQEQPLWN